MSKTPFNYRKDESNESPKQEILPPKVDTPTAPEDEMDSHTMFPTPPSTPAQKESSTEEE